MIQDKEKPAEGLEQMQVLLDQSLSLNSSVRDRAAAMTRWQSLGLDDLSYKLVALMFGQPAASIAAGKVGS